MAYRAGRRRRLADEPSVGDRIDVEL